MSLEYKPRMTRTPNPARRGPLIAFPRSREFHSITEHVTYGTACPSCVRRLERNAGDERLSDADRQNDAQLATILRANLPRRRRRLREVRVGASFRLYLGNLDQVAHAELVDMTPNWPNWPPEGVGPGG